MKKAMLFVLVGALFVAVVSGQETALEDEHAQLMAQVKKQLLKITTSDTPFDYVSYYVSGPVVVLDGFTVQPTFKAKSEEVVRQLEWVTHVVNKIQYTPQEARTRELRSKILSILQQQLPTSFGGNRALIRIKVVEYEVTLVGIIAEIDKARLERAIVQIKGLPLITSVDNQVAIRKK